MWLKACPRCGGDLFQEVDSHGSYVGCLQCGHQLTREQESVLQRQSRYASQMRLVQTAWAQNHQQAR